MKHHTHLSRQRGAALVVGLILLAIITLLAVVGMNVSNSELQQATTEQLRLRAFQAAETGFEYAIPDMKKVSETNPKLENPATGVTGSPLNPGDGKPFDTYKVTIEYRGVGSSPPGFSTNFAAYHYSVVSDGSSARNSVARHELGAYLVNQSNNDTFGKKGTGL
jgi:Tfp pilus assembly protein PilX